MKRIVKGRARWPWLLAAGICLTRAAAPAPPAAPAPAVPPAATEAPPALQMPPAPTGEPLGVDPSALLALENEQSLAITGIRGQIIVEALQERELRVISRGPGDNGPEIPVGIWAVGSKLVVAPPPGSREMLRSLHVGIPRTLALRVDAVNSEVFALGIDGSVDIHGQSVRATVNGNTGTTSVDLIGGSLSLIESGEATLKLRDTEAMIGPLSGSISLHAKGGKIQIVKADGVADIESEGSQIGVAGVRGTVRVRARKGNVTVAKNEQGGDFEMAGAALALREGKGEITVTSDAAVDFQAMAATLHLDVTGGTVRGNANQGSLEARGRNAELNLQGVTGPVHIQGDTLKASIVNTREELSVENSGGDVLVDGAGALTLKLDRGSAIVRGAGTTTATLNGGNARIIDGTGAVNLEMDGGDGVVSWASIPADKDSHLVNKSGSLTIHFPRVGYCHIIAKSDYGRVDTDLAEVKIADDLGSAEGSVNRGNRPFIRIEARGDIHLVNGSPQENPENQENNESAPSDDGH